MINFRRVIRRGSRRSNRLERIAALAALVCIFGLALPWYRAPFERQLSESGFESFGFAQAALLLTAGAALFLVLRSIEGHKPPLPLHEGTLLAIAGVWSALIVVFLMVDRPRFKFGAFDSDFSIAFGMFVELGAAVTLAVAGWSLRRRELRTEGPAARGPSASSPVRSPR